MLGLNQAQKCPRSRPNLWRPDSSAVYLHPNLKIKDLNSDPDQDPNTNVTLICLCMYIIYQGESEPKLKMAPQIGSRSHFSNMGHLDIWVIMDNFNIHMIMDLLGLDLSFIIGMYGHLNLCLLVENKKKN